VSNNPFWRRVGWAAAAAALLGAWVAPLPDPAPALVKPRSDAWTLSSMPRVFDQTVLAVNVLNAPYWGSVAGPAAAAPSPPAPDPGWRLAGIFGQGSERGVLVEFAAEGKPPLRLRAGDALPSGHRIQRIQEREICVRVGGRLLRLGVERSAS
jgi:hypothetical protein